MKNLITLGFQRWARKNKIQTKQLLKAVEDLKAGLADSKSLGHHLWRLRVARGNRGASAGFRVYATWVEEQRVIFLHGFQKTDADNLSKELLQATKQISQLYAELSDQAIQGLIERGELKQIE